MRALGRPIFAYTNDARSFRDRVTAFCEGVVRVRPTGEHEDADGMAIEPFELHDNLMPRRRCRRFRRLHRCRDCAPHRPLYVACGFRAHCQACRSGAVTAGGQQGGG